MLRKFYKNHLSHPNHQAPYADDFIDILSIRVALATSIEQNSDGLDGLEDHPKSQLARILKMPVFQEQMNRSIYLILIGLRAHFNCKHLPLGAFI